VTEFTAGQAKLSKEPCRLCKVGAALSKDFAQIVTSLLIARWLSHVSQRARQVSQSPSDAETIRALEAPTAANLIQSERRAHAAHRRSTPSRASSRREERDRVAKQEKLGAGCLH